MNVVSVEQFIVIWTKEMFHNEEDRTNFLSHGQEKLLTTDCNGNGCNKQTCPTNV